MINRLTEFEPFSYLGWYVAEIGGGKFKAWRGNGYKSITFEVDYTTGLYFKIIDLYNNGRHYTAQKFLYKYTTLIRELSYKLLLNNSIWSYSHNTPALALHKKLSKNA